MKISEILKHAPMGTQLYSPMIGNCYLDSVSENDGDIMLYYNIAEEAQANLILDCNGHYDTLGECMLFPSKENKDWDSFVINMTQRNNTFKPFDKVVVKKNKNEKWTANIFSHYNDDSCIDYPYVCITGICTHCLPYNELTEGLIGTLKEYNS